MNCDEFLARHSEYVDDRLPLPAVAEMRRHVRECESCARYDRVVEQGGRALRELPYAEPSSSFYAGLRERLEEVEAEPVREPEPAFAAASASVGSPGARGAGADALATVTIAALMAAVAWSALLRTDAGDPTIELSPMVAQAPAVRASGGLFSPVSRFLPSADWPDRWWRGTVSGVGESTSPRGAALTSPLWDGSSAYSPVLFETPGTGGLQTVSHPAFE